MRKFGQLIKSIYINCIWNVFITAEEGHVMDILIRQNQELLTNTEKDFHVTTTTIMGMRSSSFCFLDGGKVSIVFSSREWSSRFLKKSRERLPFISIL